MSKDELRNTYNTLFQSELECGVNVYAFLQEENNRVLKKIITLEDIDRRIKEIIKDVIKNQYIDEEIEFEDIANIADDKKAIYMLLQSDEYRPFELINNNETSKSFSDDDIDKLMGFVFKFNINSNTMFVYQQVYVGSRIRKSYNVIHMIMDDDKYDLFEKSLLRIDKRAEIIILGEQLYVKNINLLQDKFGFQKYIRHEAESAIEIIERLEIVSDVEKIKSCESSAKLTVSKKLMKIKDSPVLELDKQTLMNRLSAIDGYKDKIVFENDKIRTKTIKDVNILLKMLNDDYVRSELTEKDYDSPVKKIV